MGRAIVLIGFMGAGKSTAVSALSNAGERATQDLDVELEARAGGKTVRDLFDADEGAFRALEGEVAVELLNAAPEASVIALGGGSPMQPDIRAVLDDHTVVLLDVKADQAWERVSASDRPLVQRGREDFEELLRDRVSTYEGLAQVVLPAAKPDSIVEALPWIRALQRLPDGARMIWATTDSGEYPIVIGRGILESDWWPLEGRQFFVCDPNTQDLLTDPMRASGEPIVIKEAGETAKTMATATWILERLADSEMTREDYVVALGGGVIGDVAGFCAHLYQRGVQVVQVPTTLVAQVDSAYGGKTGVDLPQGKNYAGAYHQPAAVIVDVGVLDGLPVEEVAAGYVEALKTGLLSGGRLWERVRDIEKLASDELTEIVFECARFKCAVVAEDERDGGRRHILNLGHTIGHAIESASGYTRYRHGEAIGLGLLGALRLSRADDLRTEVEEILQRHDLPVTLDPDVDINDVLISLGRDKKRTTAGVGFVLLPELGNPQTGEILDPADVEAAIKELYP
jgi:shikimate kinase/3-dehydroquinate synthase